MEVLWNGPVSHTYGCFKGGRGAVRCDGNYGQNNVYYVDQMTSILIASTNGAICFLENDGQITIRN